VVEPVLRLEAEQQRRIAVLLEDDGGGQRRFEAMGGAARYDTRKVCRVSPPRSVL
jgi:hypothetical protein